MKTWTLHARLDATERLRLDVPIADGPQDVDVVLVVSPRDAEQRRADWDLVSSRLGTLAVTEDPAAWQRQVRSHWTKCACVIPGGNHESVIAACALPRGAPALRHNPYLTKRGASPRGYLNNSRFFHESRRSI